MAGRVRAVGRGGDGVVETNEGIVLTPGCLPGESVEIRPVVSRRGARRGKLIRISESSAQRRVAPCHVADQCGGCPLMIATDPLERTIKEGFLSEACEGLPGARDATRGWVSSPAGLAYRSRARLAWNRDTLGYRRRQSSALLDVSTCIVLGPRLQLAWDATRATLGDSLTGRGDIQLSRSGNAVVVQLSTPDEQPPATFTACAVLAQDDAIRGVELSIGAGAPAHWGDVVIQTSAYDGSTLVSAAGGFAQANDEVNRALVEEVVDLAAPGGKRVLELHCGIGNFTVALAREAASLVAVERDSTSVRACQRNLTDRGLRARVVIGDANTPPKGNYEVVVLDPPRQGARALFESSDSWTTAERIVYVSCDTATLQRDLHQACKRGFSVDHMIAFDMFPQTAHVESVVRLVR